MPNGIHITLTVNLKDGREINDIEGSAGDLYCLTDAVVRMLDEQGIEEDDYSSLVIAVVPQ